MARTEFTATPYDPHNPRKGYSVFCRYCAATDTIYSNNPGSKRYPTDKLVQKFAERGWTVGKNTGSDVCPKCTERQAKKAKESNVVPIKNEEVKAEAPRKMEREDKRIIFAKLNDVYLNENEGYAQDWSDERVAKDIGCPLAWVRQVRDENFGPEGLNADAREAIAQINDAKAHIEGFAKELLALNQKFQDVQRRAHIAIKHGEMLEKKYGTR